MKIENKIDELTREVFRFSAIRDNLYLDSYSLEKRQSTRHRIYTPIQKYDRFMSRDSTIEACEVPLTREIRQEAINEYCDSIECLLWGERRI